MRKSNDEDKGHGQCSQPLSAFAEACLTLSPKVFLREGGELYIDLTPTIPWFGSEEKWVTAFEKLRESFSVKTPYVVVDRLEWAKAFYIIYENSTESSPPRETERTVRGRGRRSEASEAYPEGTVRKPSDEDKGHGQCSQSLVVPLDQSHSWLGQMPIERLMVVGDPGLLAAERKDREYLVSFMRRVGISQICDFARLDTTAISRRFGRMGVLLKSWLDGNRAIPLPTFVPKEPIKEFIDTEELGSMEGLLHLVEQAFERISSRLIGRGEAANSIKLTFHLDGQPLQYETVKFHEPVRESSRLIKPVREFCQRPRWENPLKFVEIEVVQAVPFSIGQLSLIDTTENKMSDLGYYVQNLRARLGEAAVGFAELKESYLPEHSWKRAWPPPKNTSGTRPFLGIRPPILFFPARPYAPQRSFKLVPSENLAAEWWEDSGAYRRYFIAHTPFGERLWVFWDCQKQEWFLQGSFD